MSFFDSFTENLQTARQGLTKTVPVPRWKETTGCTVLITCKPIDDDTLNKAEANTGSVVDEARLGDQQALVDATTKITFEGGGETKEFSGFGDPALAELLKVAEHRAIANVDALFFTDGDMHSFADGILRWSGYRNPDVLSKFLGE